MDKAEAIDTLQSVIEVLGCDFVSGYIKARKEMLKTNEKTPGKMSEYIIRETTFPLATSQKVVGELVRCKDCKWRHDDSNPQYLPCTDWYPQDCFFCAYGERRE